MPVNCTGQGCYSYRQKGQHRTPTGFNPLTIAGCFNYNDSEHLVKDCGKSLYISCAAAILLECLNRQNTSNAFNLVLANLCQQLDVNGQMGGEPESHDDYAKMFDSLLDKLPEDTG